jgi:hypothetical protein
VKTTPFFAIAALTTFTAQAIAAPEVYLDETTFLNELAAMGYAAIHEGFEDDAVWGAVRSPAKAPAVSSQGATWSANNLSSEITTGNGPALTGEWGFYSLPHGSYDTPDPGASCFNPEECGDGFRATANTGAFIAHGGWIETNTPFAKLGIYLGNYPDNPIDLGETCDPPGSENCQGNDILGTESKFFGVIDPAGFERIEYRELEGKLEPPGGGDLKYIFADDFYFGLEDGEVIFSDGFED